MLGEESLDKRESDVNGNLPVSGAPTAETRDCRRKEKGAFAERIYWSWLPWLHKRGRSAR